MKRPPLVVLALVVAFAGLFAASTLSLGHVLKLPVPCGGSGGCAAVAHHPSSKVFGVPIAFAGVGLYVAFAALLVRAPASQGVRRALVVLAGAATVVSGFLVVYSRNVIQATCPWCVASAAFVAVLFALSIAVARRAAAISPRPSAPDPRAARVAWILAFVTAAAVGVQAGLMTRAANRPPVAAETLAAYRLEDLVDPSKALGPVDAPVTVLIFGDFMCPACRAAHADLAAWRAANPHGVRLAFRHQPLWEASAAAAAVSEVAAEHGKFWSCAALLYARPRFDREGFRLLAKDLGLDDETVESRVANGGDPALARLRRDVDLAERLGITSTPVILIGLKGRPVVSVSPRRLADALNSAEVQSLLRPLAESRPAGG